MSENQPAIKHDYPLFAAVARLDAKIAGYPLDYIAQANLLIADKPRQTYSMRMLVPLHRVVPFTFFCHTSYLLAFIVNKIW
jgi:hypothetical protein